MSSTGTKVSHLSDHEIKASHLKLNRKELLNGPFKAIMIRSDITEKASCNTSNILGTHAEDTQRRAPGLGKR